MLYKYIQELYAIKLASIQYKKETEGVQLCSHCDDDI
jgi:hypothetical protein